MKRLFILIILLLTSSVIYGDIQNNCNEPIEKVIPKIINEPNRINVCTKNDFYINASYIYWKVDTDNNVPADDNFTLGRIDYRTAQRYSSKYKSGLKLGAGYAFDKTNWEVNFDYTRFHSTIQNDVSTTGSYVDYWGITGNTFQRSLTTFEVEYDMFNLVLSKPILVGRYLSFTPGAGLKGGFLDMDYTNGTIPYSSDSWLIGPKFLMNINWEMSHNIRFITNLNGSVLFQKFTDVDMDSSSKFYTDNSYNQIAPNIGSQLGLGWGKFLDKRKLHLDFFAGWELNYYWNQNTIRRLISSDYNNITVGPNSAPSTGNTSNGDLWLTGLTVTGRFDF